jgi:UPF0755 protein
MSVPKSYLPAKKKKRKLSFTSCFLILLIIVIAICVIAYFVFKSWYGNGVSQPNSDDTSIVTIEVETGTSPSQIGQLLYEYDLIQDTTLWDLYVRINNIGSNLLADKYRLPKNLSIKQIADTLQRPAENSVVWVTFPEGLNFTQMSETLQARQDEFIDDKFFAAEFVDVVENPDRYEFEAEVQEFLDKYKPSGNTLEGFLYPNTYAFEIDMTARDVVEMILQGFLDQISTIDIENGKYNFYDALILASIVERESIDSEDRKNIAAIFDNRIEQNYPLQSDATVNYVTGKSERRPTYEDLEISSPYNTYKNAGLPPGPICNPRLESIEVSLNPIDTDYFYFVHELDGTPHYAVTEDEHFANIDKYLNN